MKFKVTASSGTPQGNGTVEINSLEELLDMCEKEQTEIKPPNEYFRDETAYGLVIRKEHDGEWSIEIYDSYRE